MASSILQGGGRSSEKEAVWERLEEEEEVELEVNVERKLTSEKLKYH